MLRRATALLAAAWAGGLAALGFIGAPAGFAILPPQVAGQVAGRMFAQEAYLGLALSVLLIVLLRRLGQADADAGRGSVFSTDLVLALGTLFCTLLGYFGIQPMMAQARLSQGALSFGALHGISMGFFGLKLLLAAALAWRLTAH